MLSSWIKQTVKYGFLLLPSALLLVVLAHVAAGIWIAAIFDDPQSFDDAPGIVRGLTRSIYANTRTHWQIQSECIDFDTEVLYRPRPGQCRFRNAEFDTWMNFDAAGRRQTARPAADSVRAEPILVIGDSHAMGWGVEDDETFASRLAISFGYEVSNFGVSSYGTVRELRALSRARPLPPDSVLIIQYSDNDLEENLTAMEGKPVGPYDSKDLDPLITYIPTPSEPLPIAGQVLRRTRSVAEDKLLGVFRASGGTPASGPDPTRPARAFLAVLDEFPFVFEQRILVVAINGHGQRSHLEDGRALLESRGLDLLSPSLSTEHFFRIDDHMRPEGHAEVARQIADRLAAL